MKRHTPGVSATRLTVRYAPRTVVPRLILVLHAIFAGAMTGACTHLAIATVALARKRARPRLLRVFLAVGVASWCTAIGLGFAIYPRYRTGVRAAWLATREPNTARVFDVKEALALFIGPLLCAAWLALRDAVDRRDATALRLMLGSTLVAALCGWFALIAGLVVASARAI